MSFRSLLLNAVGIALTVIGPPVPAAAQLTVVCPTCSSLVKQVVQDAREAQSYLTQLDQYRTELQSYANMVQNTVALPMQAWNTVQSDIQRVQALSNASAMLSGRSGGMLSQLNSLTGYANQVGGLANMPQQLAGWQQSFSDSASQFARAMGLQQSQATNNAALVQQMQAHSSSATGQMQAIQAGNELASATVNQLMQVQATISASTQYAVQRDIALADRTALNDAAMQAFMGGKPPATTGYQSW